MMPRSMAMMAIALAVSGCATGNDPALLTGSVTPVAPTLIADVAPDHAAAYLPRVAGRVEAVRQSSSPDQIFQTILYPNPGYQNGENALKVSIAPPSSGSSYFQAPSQRQIMGEIREALPDVPMRISGAPGQNLHGPFGYATGALASGGSCIFAWQTAGEIGRAEGSGFKRLTRSSYAAKVRLRYCHPDMGEAALVSLMSGLRIREISATTLEMLRFAEGSGVALKPGYAAERVEAPAVAKKVQPAAEPVAIRSASKPEAEEEAAPLSNAPRVLKPGELAGYSTARETRPVVLAGAAPDAHTIAKAPSIPLPGALSR
ncbi:MAG: cellulose biosynthesis protein BcsN [Hoeflea sp.]|nr:cellulose biosynthesis protein BcsN [Hoeflea sp.]